MATKVFWIFLLGPILCTPAWADAASCKRKCEVPLAPTGEHYVQVDASKIGQTIIRKYGQSDRVSVIVKNKNPYRYEYKTTIQSRPLAQDIITDFFTAVQFPTVSTSRGGASLAATMTCSDPPTKNAIALYLSDFNKSEPTSTEVKTLNDFKTLIDGYNELLTATVSTISNCPGICLKAENLGKQLPKLIAFDPKGLAAKVQAFKDAESKLPAIVQAIANIADTTEKDNCEKKLTALKSDHDTRGKAINEVSEALTKVSHGKKGFQALLEVIQAVEKDNEAFVQVIPIPMSDRPLNTTVTLTRRDRRTEGATEETVATVDIDSGEVPLTVSIGTGFSSVDDVEIVRQAGPGDTAGTTVNRFGFKSNSSFKPSFVMNLNGHVHKFANDRVTLGATAGFVVSNRSGNVEP